MNLYKVFKELIPSERLDIGQIIAVHDDGVTVELPTGATMRVRGGGTVGDYVYLRGGAVSGPAPSLPVVSIEV